MQWQSFVGKWVTAVRRGFALTTPTDGCPYRLPPGGGRRRRTRPRPSPRRSRTIPAAAARTPAAALGPAPARLAAGRSPTATAPTPSATPAQGTPACRRARAGAQPRASARDAADAATLLAVSQARPAHAPTGPSDQASASRLGSSSRLSAFAQYADADAAPRGEPGPARGARPPPPQQQQQAELRRRPSGPLAQRGDERRAHHAPQRRGSTDSLPQYTSSSESTVPTAGAYERDDSGAARGWGASAEATSRGAQEQQLLQAELEAAAGLGKHVPKQARSQDRHPRRRPSRSTSGELAPLRAPSVGTAALREDAGGEAPGGSRKRPAQGEQQQQPHLLPRPDADTPGEALLVHCFGACGTQMAPVEACFAMSGVCVACQTDGEEEGLQCAGGGVTMHCCDAGDGSGYKQGMAHPMLQKPDALASKAAALAR